MRFGLTVLALLFVAAVPATAAGIVMPDDKSARFDAFAQPEIDHPWTDGRPLPRLQEEPAGDLIARRLGLVNGSLELFRTRVENAPSDKTMLDGAIDGGGIKIKLTW